MFLTFTTGSTPPVESSQEKTEFLDGFITKVLYYSTSRARSSVDRATDSGSVGRGFKSLRARSLLYINIPTLAAGE